MCETENFSFLSADGIHQIQCRLWLPACPPRGVVQIVHGVAEHMGRYEDTARFLTGHGFAVCGEDHLGHGRTASDGKYGYFGPKNGWSLLVRDIAQLRQRMGRRFPGIPYFILGHSMGSFLTRTYLIQYPGTVHGAILSGTGQEAPALVSMGQALSALLCRLKGPDYVSDLVYSLSLGNYNRPFRPSRTDSDWLSRDEASVDAFLADPLCGFHPTVGMFRDMLGGIRFIGAPCNAAKMDPATPVLFLSGDRDPVGSMGAGVQRVAKLFTDAGCRSLSVKLYPGARHEILNETNRREVWDDLLRWLEKNLPL